MKTKEIKVNLKEKSYSILINQNLLGISGNYIKQLNVGKKILIVTNDHVPRLFISKVKKNLIKNGFLVHLITIPSGEQYKNINSVLKITNFAIKNKYERNDSFIALGGGVISDLTGFAASIYYRGLNFICIPTTLLGMVDASIGGKTSTNIKQGKNLIGTFYQPKIVLIDSTTLKTLPKKELLVGMGEIIKYALLEITSKTKFSHETFFTYLEKNKNKILNLNPKELTEIIFHSAKTKANIVSKDEKESNLRAILNLGHTFAHGIEQAYDYKKYTHGEAVSIGTCYASKLAVKEKLITIETRDKIIGIFKNYGLPTLLPNKNKLKKIISSMLLDKKVKDGRLRLILPDKQIGKVKIVNNVSINKIKSVF